MPKRKKRTAADKSETWKLIEIQCAVIQHCQALRAVTAFLEQGKTEAAVARLDGAVTALEATVRGQTVGKTMKCPACGSEQEVVAWVDDHRCRECGEVLELPEAGA